MAYWFLVQWQTGLEEQGSNRGQKERSPILEQQHLCGKQQIDRAQEETTRSNKENQ